ncbi:hypothetical protein OUZ56_030081 [Daphnia magna]|uniref:Uncharacterized protein n=1 Tax=Daphnia magna TaxID=35525 RepID=A0ABQ9ZQ88_9CRUS|nr:hypothetical protein OUZ56_030081 [Daphnia magna]
MGLLDSSRLSWRHFDEEDIIKGKFILGKFYPQQLWRLRDGATPKHLLGLKRQQNNSRPELEDLTQNGPEVKNKKQQSRCKTITSILGKPISSLVQNQFTTLPHTECTKSSQPLTESLCTNALSDSGFSQVKTFDVLLMDSAPVPITTALPDPGSSQVTTFDYSLLDSALVPITTALPDPGSSQVMFEDDFPIDSSLGPDDLIDTGSGQEPLRDVSPIYSPLLPDIDVPKASVHVGGQNVTLPGCDGRYEGYDDINHYLRILSNVKACKGFLNDAMENVNVTRRCSITRNGQVLRSTSCRYIASPNSKTDLCRDCANCLRNLRKRVMQPKNIEIYKRKLTTALQNIRRLKSREVVRS